MLGKHKKQKFCSKEQISTRILRSDILRKVAIVCAALMGSVLLVGCDESPIEKAIRQSAAAHEAVERALALEREQILSGPSILIRSYRCHNEYGYMHSEGLIENISDTNIENLEAVATYFTSTDTFITSDGALIEYDPIMPGQKSPFKVLTRYNPAISNCRIAFKQLSGGAVESITLQELTHEAQQLLKRLGYYRERIDGVSGPATMKALQEFAVKSGLKEGASLMDHLKALRASTVSGVTRDGNVE